MGIQSNIRGSELEQNISLPDQVQDRLRGLKDKIDALSETSEKNKLNTMAANMSAATLTMVMDLADGDPDKEEAFAAINDMINNTFELRELDNIVHAPNFTEGTVKPSKIKRDARKRRFELIMPGGGVDIAFTRLFNIYKKLDDRLNGKV
ncbi:MAG: hypothetical protein Q8P68_06335 [Candidatus Peregrinibacteria bacterium]|nr:hypothetical protein [Candidatus Peregrinibacteria bacterium]MDZ4244413.1 hypothetical protein [Candidatus Gracilibacteria bacterium]